MNKSAFQFLASLSVALFSAVFINSAEAQSLISQAIPDSSLGTEASSVRPAETNIGGQPTNLVEGGAVRGNTLFHSFSTFNIDDQQQLYFSPSNNITNIFTRVTGNTSSEILGTLGVLGNADFFLMNPNGIFFGADAQLDIKGSFFATSADEFAFSDDFVFSTQSQNSPPEALLTVQPSALLFNRLNPAPIESEGRLRVEPGESVQLVGGDIQLSDNFKDAISAREGLIELGGLSEPGIVTFLANGKIQLPDDTARADISLAEATLIVSDGMNGDINLYGHDITLEDSRIIAGFEKDGGSPQAQAGNIIIDTDGSMRASRTSILNSVRDDAIGNSGDLFVTVGEDISLDDSNIISIVGKRAEGTVGNVVVTVGENAQLTNNSIIGSRLIGRRLTDSEAQSVDIRVSGDLLLYSSDLRNSVISTGDGDAGDLNIQADLLEIVTPEGTSGNAQSLISTANEGNGNAGNLRIAVNELSMTGPGRSGPSGIISNAGTARSEGIGNAGSILIDVAGPMLMTRRGKIEAVVSDTVGQSGDVVINAESLSLENISSILAINRRSVGAPGNIIINVDGSLDIAETSTITAAIGNDAIANRSLDDETGNITINAGAIRLSERGRIETLTQGNDNAGNILITADSLVIEDFYELGRTKTSASGIFSSSRPQASGEGGDIDIQARMLRVSGNAVINASTEGTLTGGNIDIDADEINLVNGGQVLTSSFSQGDSGDISLTSNQFLVSGNDPSFADQLDNTERLLRQNKIRDARQVINRVGENRVAPSGAFSQSRGEENLSGDAGDLTVTAEQLTVDNGARLSADTFGAGDGGAVDLSVTSLNLQSGGQIRSGSLSRVRDNSLSLGPVNSSIPSGLGGTLRVEASERILISGSNSTGEIAVPSALITLAEGTGNAGNLFINESPTGDLTLLVQDGGEINASTTSSTGGNISVNNLNALILRDRGRIVAEAGSAQSAGNGGNITMLMPDGFLVTVPTEDSDIIANAFEGDGGDIAITARSILGFSEQPAIADNGSSDIDASSQFGTNGNVVTNNLEVDPARGLIELPSETASPFQVANRCLADSESSNTFVSTGQGGIHPDPTDIVRNEISGWVDLGQDVAVHNAQVLPIAEKPLIEPGGEGVPATTPPEIPLVEAQNWQKDAQGNIVLMLQTPNTDRINHDQYPSCEFQRGHNS
ncbi:MAG: filamentous hemagglutinin N-terminal domain-containing protein [Cyanobacteria bacterium P01_F01_bin.86]